MRHDLQEKWNLIERFLRNARIDLPKQQDPSPEFAALVTEFDEFISRNELDPALDSIAAAGQMVEPGGRFWHSLLQAAQQMGRTEQAEDFQFRFIQAAIRGLKRAQEGP